MTESQPNGNGVRVRSWVLTAVLSVAGAGLTFLASYETATARSQADIAELERRVSSLEHERVTKAEFDATMQDIKDRLTRIENGIDRTRR